MFLAMTGEIGFLSSNRCTRIFCSYRELQRSEELLLKKVASLEIKVKGLEQIQVSAFFEEYLFFFFFFLFSPSFLSRAASESGLSDS